MMHNPVKSNFNVIIPPEFFLEEVTQKYNLGLSQYNMVQNNIADIFTESIQSITLPEIGYNVVTQTTQDANNAGYDWNQMPKESEQKLVQDKNFVITMRHIDGFMTYFYALEVLYTYYQLGGLNPTKRKPFATPIILETLSTHNREVMCRWKMYKCNLIGISSLNLAFNEVERTTQTFDLTFAYTEFETTLNVPQPIFR